MQTDMVATTIVGIDNGINGGLCAISSHSGNIIERIPMPTYTYSGKEEVDVAGLLEFLIGFRYPESLLVCLEEPLRHAKSSQAMRSMSINFGKILGACEAKKIPTRRVDVKKWQDKLLGKLVPKGKTKEYAELKAKEIWPDENWLATSRSKVAHDGMVDAGLIAYYIWEQSR